jgi:pyruvate/2-oxoglutarate dehydrogenase complex dihydrolipoamide acyltransferase (E2) component
MKMEHSLAAPFDGIVAELGAREGAQVSEGTLLVRVEKVLNMLTSVRPEVEGRWQRGHHTRPSISLRTNGAPQSA